MNGNCLSRVRTESNDYLRGKLHIFPVSCQFEKFKTLQVCSHLFLRFTHFHLFLPCVCQLESFLIFPRTCFWQVPDSLLYAAEGYMWSTVQKKWELCSAPMSCSCMASWTTEPTVVWEIGLCLTIDFSLMLQMAENVTLSDTTMAGVFLWIKSTQLSTLHEYIYILKKTPANYNR